ncbi:PMT family glycosyltransferase, 4-amino-4-deoxy-L-arabinose transferase [Beggiatoa alba B18LD]|uniref:PMT family glycosyltransferase, 4-amino-4-deoxy-L-arabinose transferase n=1 Tax=Beggiatoa alba B18LD TaxID=395493 RepID=I3CGY7_9GAMM|nr:RICIN domain-containing protein [Beggiatoa alba]EIJ42880.1 PMT family glycosyltransferase, 4-amino-4-deoxy-L-arabinose transferase [Beggiatoa alba B18LD]
MSLSPAFSRLLTYYFIALFCSIFVLNCLYSVRQPVWSPLDEWAHYDYIEQLSHWQLPDATQPFAPYTQMISSVEFKKPIQGVQTSYQAQQPPVYYALLAIPNYLLKQFNVTPTHQIKLLRLFNPFFIALACIILWLVFRTLAVQTDINPQYGYGLILTIMLLDADRRYGLNNNYLPLLWNSLCLLYLVRWWQCPTKMQLTLAIGFAVLGFLTKYTNAYMLVICYSTVFFAYCNPTKRVLINWLRQLPVASLPLGLILLFFLFNYIHTGSLLNTQMTQQLFSASVYSVNEPLHFINLFFKKLLNTSHIFELPDAVIWFAGLNLVINLIMGAYDGFYRHHPWSKLIFLSALLTAGLLGAGWWLNIHQTGIYWFEYRHYAGYIGFSLLAITPIYFLTAYFKKILWGVYLFLLTGMTSVYAFQVSLMFDTPKKQLVNQANQQCLEAPPFLNYRNGTPLWTQACQAIEQQLWRYNYHEQAIKIAKNTCIDASIDDNFRHTDGSIIFFWDCLATANQVWYYDESRHQFRTEEGKCLTMVNHGANNEEGMTSIRLWTCNDSLEQQWVFK